MEQFYVTYECPSGIDDHIAFFEALKEVGDKLKQEGVEYWITTEEGRQDYFYNLPLSRYSVHLRGEAENIKKVIEPFLDITGPPAVVESKGANYLDDYLRGTRWSLRRGGRKILDFLSGRIVSSEVAVEAREGAELR